jgi:hypothetical protein
MFRLSKSVLSFGAGTLALGVLMLAAPRAAHAIAATLVQVTNTAANPAITQSANTQAAQLVELSTESLIPPGSDNDYQPVHNNANGADTPGYTVPAGVSLVITSADVTATNTAEFASFAPCASPDHVILTNGTGNIRARWMLAAGQGTAHFTYPSGIVFLSGAVPYMGIESACYTWVQMQGYYTAN